MSEEMIRQISEAIRIRGERPARVQIQDMIDRGAIDQSGRVLLQGPNREDFDTSSNETSNHSVR